MTPEQASSLATQSGFTQIHKYDEYVCSLKELTAFAKSIEAHTREECAKVVEQEIRYGTAYEYVNHNLAIKLIADKIRSMK